MTHDESTPAPDRTGPSHRDSAPTAAPAHTHGHLADLGPAPARVRGLIAALVLPLVAATLAALVMLWPDGEAVAGDFAFGQARGTVLEVRPCDNPTPDCVVGTVELTGGIGAPGRVTAALPFGPGAPEVGAGDDILLTYVEQAPEDERYGFQDFDRSRPLSLLLGVFVVAVLVLSRWRGLGSLLSLGFSLGVLVLFTLPALTEGATPLLVAVVTASLIMVVTLFLSHGVSVPTGIAMVGTLVALVSIGLLGSLFTEMGRFTGLADEGSQYISAINDRVDLSGLLLAGLVIGALGVLDDVTVTQTSVVWELADADPDASRLSLFTRGMRIGRAHVASTVNTLALAYVGATLPLLLVFSTIQLPFGTAISLELVAQEVVRTLVGGLGILLAVPVTTGLAAFVAGMMAQERRLAHRNGSH